MDRSYEPQDLAALALHVQRTDSGLSAKLAELIDLGTRRPPVPGLPERTLTARLLISDPAALHVGYLLPDLDRELRRAAAFQLGSDAARDELTVYSDHQVRASTRWRPSPLPGRALVVISAQRSSPLDVLLEVVDAVRDLLLSTPVQLLITLSWFWEHRPGRGTTRRTHPLEEIVKETNRTVQKAIGSGVPLRVRWHTDNDGNLVPDFDVLPTSDSH